MSELTFYDDYYRERIMTFPEYDRTKLKLDLNPNLPLSSMKRKYLSPAQTNAILQSPDLKLLKLASPELEKLIIQGNGFLTTPTPTGTGGGPDIITEEQEQFARGFIEALQKLQNKDDTTTSSTAQSCATASATLSSRSSTTAGVFQAATSQGNSYATNDFRSVNTKGKSKKIRTGTGVRFINTPRTSSNSRATAAGFTLANSTNLMSGTRGQVVQPGQQYSNVPAVTSIEATASTTSAISLSHPQQFLPQTVVEQTLANTSAATASMFVYTSANSSLSQGDSLGTTQANLVKTEEGLQIVPSGALNVSPIDLDLQEKVKHQRKKLRNRLAAQRCRKRKIEREDELKDRVKELKTQESDLKNAARDLRSLICDLKQEVLQHVNSGCRVILASQSADTL